jgi:hypothetical protein
VRGRTSGSVWLVLTLADLATSSVWEFALDEEGVEGQDETTVRPYAVRRSM